jgi:hypothetical protein
MNSVALASLRPDSPHQHQSLVLGYATGRHFPVGTTPPYIDPPIPAGGIFLNSGRRGSFTRSISDADLGSDGAAIQPCMNRIFRRSPSVMRVDSSGMTFRCMLIQTLIIGTSPESFHYRPVWSIDRLGRSVLTSRTPWLNSMQPAFACTATGRASIAPRQWVAP